MPFPHGICSKVNTVARLEFELACYNIAVQKDSYYPTGKLPFVLKATDFNTIFCYSGLSGGVMVSKIH